MTQPLAMNARAIKFRLRVGSKIVGYEKWYSGCWLYSIDGVTWNPEYIYHDAKDEFCGLKDKNGKEIYEGELMRGRDGTLWEVFWRKEVAGFEFVGMTGAMPDSWMPNIDEVASEWESVGNIYENENLLRDGG